MHLATTGDLIYVNVGILIWSIIKGVTVLCNAFCTSLAIAAATKAAALRILTADVTFAFEPTCAIRTRAAIVPGGHPKIRNSGHRCTYSFVEIAGCSVRTELVSANLGVL